MKELKCSSLEENKVKFLQEAVIMGQFNHINVVRIYGVVTLDEPVSLLHMRYTLCDIRGPSVCLHTAPDCHGTDAQW